MYEPSKLIQPYKYIMESQYLEGLENLIIEDSRAYVNWRWLQLMTPERFSSLKYLNVPTNAFYDYNVSDEILVQYFPGLHITYTHSAFYSGSLCNRLFIRFLNKSFFNLAQEAISKFCLLNILIKFILNLFISKEIYVF